MYNKLKKKRQILFMLMSFSVIFLGAFAHGQSIPSIGSVVSVSTISQPRIESQCVEPDGTIVYKNKNFYFGDTYTTRDLVPKRLAGYDTLFLNNSNVLIYNPSLFNFTSSIKRRSNGIPNSAAVNNVVAMDGTFVVNSIASGQLVYNIYRTALGNGGSTNYSVSYLGWPNLLNYTTNLTNKTFYNIPGRVVSGHECVNYVVHYCGDGDVDTAQSIASLPGGKSNSIANEQCDPADSTHQGWGNLGCSNSCVPLTQAKPTCNLSVTDSLGVYSIFWNINGTFNNPTSITITPTSVNPSNHLVTTSNGTWSNIVPTGYGLYTASMVVSNAAGSNTCRTSFTLSLPVTACGDGNIDWPNTSGVYEECDNGNIYTSGCDANCKLTIPTCVLTGNLSSQILGNVTTFVASKDTWSTYKSFDLDDGTVLFNNINFPYNYTYNNTGLYIAKLTVENSSPKAAKVVRPTNICTFAPNILPLTGKLLINKILLTTGGILPGDFVDYRIELTNIGSGTFYNAYINDIFPSSLDLISHTITGISLYNSGDWQDINGDWIFEYSGFNLLSGQMVVVNVRGQVRNGALSSETINCAFTSGDYDCEIYSLLPQPYVLKSQMMSNGGMSTNFITGVMSVSLGDYITYKIDFANIGGATTSGVRVVDHMPLCIDYISANIYGVNNANFGQSQDINGRYIIEYTGFELAAGQTGYMIITGQMMNTAACSNVKTYINNAYTYFYNPTVVVSSSTTALRSNHSIVNLTKSSNIDSHYPGDDKLFIIRVENFGPNAINNIILDDIWPAGTCIGYVDRTGAGFMKDPIVLKWIHTGALLPGDTLVLNVSGSILNNPVCVHTGYENIVNMTYTELGVSYTGSANYYFDVLNTPLANISLVKTANVSSVSSGDEIIYTIRYQNIGNTTLINYVLFDYWPATVDFVSANPFPSSIVNLATGSTLQWNFNTLLIPGQTGEIILKGNVK